MSASLLVLVLSAAPGVEKQTLSACIGNSTKAQEAKLGARYLEALRGYSACAASECPDAIRADCGKGLTEVEALVPTVVFAVRDEKGLDVSDAVLTLDGEPVPLDGKPRQLDPGRHRLVVSKGAQTLDQPLIVTAGEKSRVVTLSLVTLVVPNPPPEPVPQPSPSTRLGPWVLGGVALVATGVFTGFGLAGRAAWTQLSQKPCAATRTCLEADQAPIRSQFLIADSALAVALTAGVAALVWWFLPP